MFGQRTYNIYLPHRSGHDSNVVFIFHEHQYFQSSIGGFWRKSPCNMNLACRLGISAVSFFGWTRWSIAPRGGQGSSESFAFLGPLSTTWGYRSTRSPKKWSSRNTKSTCQIHVTRTFSPKPSLGTLKILVFEENKNYITIMSAPMRQIYINKYPSCLKFCF